MDKTPISTDQGVVDGSLWPGPQLPAITHSYLSRAADSLREAVRTNEIPTRYASAHVAALRAAAAVLSARAHLSTNRRQKNAWILLSEVAPELGEWASFFAAGAAKRAAAEAGSTRAVTEREADDLVREAHRFLVIVEDSLGLDPQPVVGNHAVAVTHSVG